MNSLHQLSLNKTNLFLVLALSMLLFYYSFFLGDSSKQNNISERLGESPITIETQINAEGPDKFPNQFQYIIRTFGVNKDFFQNIPEKTSLICVKNISVELIITGRDYWARQTRNSFYDKAFIPADESTCVSVDVYAEIGDGYKTIIKFGDYKTVIDLAQYIYYRFPFDSLYFTVGSTVEIQYFDSNQVLLAVKSFPVTTYLTNEYKDWYIENVTVVAPENPSPREVFFTLQADHYRILLIRPSAFRWLTAIILFFLALIPILISIVHATSDAIEISIAFFVAVWGFHQIILPEQSLTGNMIDIILIGESSIALLALILTIIPTFLKTRKLSNILATGSSNKYIGIRGSPVYHNSECPVVRNRVASDIIEYDNLGDAKKNSRRPCKRCL